MSASHAPTVFISYSHLDEGWKDRLVSHLGVARHQNLLYAWEDRQIGGGEDWELKIQDAMNAASVAILLVSANSLTSEYILHHEVERLLERRDREGLRIFPIIIQPCDWEAVPWLRRMNLRPKDGRPVSGGSTHDIDVDLAAISKEVRELLGRTQRTKNPPKFLPPAPEKISTGRLPITGGELFGREAELGLLDDAWADRDTNVLSLVAWGGVGKSALVNHWLRRMAQDDYRGAERVYAWSFYSQGTTDSAVSAKPFIDSALRWFGDDQPAVDSERDKGERLANLIKAQRTLLILDGLEPLQHPPGPREGRLKEPSLQALLRELAASNLGLCVLSTRLAVTDLKEFEDDTARNIDLDHLSTEAGAELLKSQGIVGSAAELKLAAAEFTGHSLALTLLGGYLTDVHGGDVRCRDRGTSLEEDVRLGRHAQRVMASYEEWFGEGPELDALRMLGLFNRPADRASIRALRAAPPIAGLTDSVQRLSEDGWQQALSKLRRAKLLAAPNPDHPDTLDTHPLVREHFGEQVKRKYPEAWREGNDRLYEHLTFTATRISDSIERMGYLVAAVTHGIEAGRTQEALENVAAYFRERDAFAREAASQPISTMTATIKPASSVSDTGQAPDLTRHPKGLYILSAVEMFERFSFYSMLAIFIQYMRSDYSGFGWGAAEVVNLYASYLMFVYVSPFIGGIIADWRLGSRRALMVGGVFFMIGYGLLSFRSLTALYIALTCLVIGNGFFKPNVSAMVGNLYPDFSRLKDRAYNIFYLGICVAAFVAPIIMQLVLEGFGYHTAFSVAAFGMLISVGVLWKFKRHIEGTTTSHTIPKGQLGLTAKSGSARAHGVSDKLVMGTAEWRGIFVLSIVFLIVIAFWMVFHQSASTLSYWADENTAWNISGTIANTLNPLWIIILTPPLIWFWGWLDRRGKEPATLTKMALGMLLVFAFFRHHVLRRTGR